MTQAQRIHRALKLAGPRGITALDFIRTPTFDGGLPITRLAARIQELREQGHVITSSEKRNKCAVYVLVVFVAPPTEEPETDVALFDPRELVRPLGAYDGIDEAA